MRQRESRIGIQLVARIQRSLLSIVAVLVLGIEARGEFVRIEPVAAKIAEQAAPLIQDATVVIASRAAGPAVASWPVHEAVAVEVTAALCARGIDAVRAESHPATASLGKAAKAFQASDGRSIKAAGRDLLVAVTVASKPPSVEIGLFPANGGEAMRKLEFELPPDCFDLNSNVPELNRKVVAFCRQHLGSPVGDGICATLAGEALQAAGAERSGVYTWGESSMRPSRLCQATSCSWNSPS